MLQPEGLIIGCNGHLKSESSRHDLPRKRYIRFDSDFVKFKIVELLKCLIFEATSLTPPAAKKLSYIDVSRLYDIAIVEFSEVILSSKQQYPNDSEQALKDAYAAYKNKIAT